MANQISSRWTYPLVGLSTSKTLPRVSANQRTAFELTGVDGSLRGGIRPFPGMVQAHQFVGGTGTVTDYTLFELRLDADSAAHGVAYIRGGNIHIDLKFPDQSDWVTQTAYEGGDAVGPLDSVSWGKVVYVLCRGRSPIAVRGYKNKDTPPTNEIGVVDPAGPGEKPRSGALFTDIASVGSDSVELNPTPLFDNFASYDVWNTDGQDQDNWGLTWAEVDTDGDSQKDDLNADGLTLLVQRRNTGTFEDPRYALHAKGDYALAYSFYDSRTGRKSMMSDVIELRAEDVDEEGENAVYSDNVKNLTFEWVWHPYTNLDEAAGSETLGLKIPKRFDEKWDRIYIWRSVKVESAGGVYVAGILHLDKIYPFRHQYTDPDSGDVIDEGGFRYIYGLEDSELVVQDAHLDHNVYFETMPRGGTATLLNDVLYMGDIVPDPVETSLGPLDEEYVVSDVYPNEALEGVGEIRWSQPLDPHPELFHWTGRHMPSTVTERPLRLFTVGEGVMAISRNRAMVVRRKGSIVLVDEIHEGYGTVSRNACAGIADSVWFVSNKGLKKVSVTGVLSDVPILDELLVQDWATDLSQCEVSFDHRSGCLWILNPVKGRAVLLWMETGMLTELEELPFTAVRTGMWPDASNVHVKRSVFLKGDTLWVADHDRQDPNIRLLKVAGEGLGLVSQVDPPTQSARGTVVVSGRSGGSVACVEGMWVHATGKPGRWRVESVTEVGNSSTVELEGEGMPEVGDTLQFSPVVLRWGGGILGARNEDGMAFLASDDMFRSRQLSSVGCVFDSLSGDGQFRAVSYFGTSSIPSQYGEYVTLEETGGLPSKYSAFGTYGVSHSSLSPGVEILCTDLDFRLLSVVCRGRIDASDRAR